MKCDKCGEKVWSVFINTKHERLCDICFEKEKNMKICSKCKKERSKKDFDKDKNRKDGLCYWCKKCIAEKCKKYYENNKIKIEKYYNKNRIEILKRAKKYYDENKEKRKKYLKENRIEILKYHQKYSAKYCKNKANYDTYAPQISYADKVKNVDGFLQVKCTYCGKWYCPTVLSIQNRIKALNGIINSKGAENRLYCSDECKQACPIYWKQLYQEGHTKKNQNPAREVQSELRQMVFERDEYICIKCGKHQDELTVPLHCHHIEGILWEPIESADIDMCMTVCKNCHKEIHQQEDCKYIDMKCKN